MGSNKLLGLLVPISKVPFHESLWNLRDTCDFQAGFLLRGVIIDNSLSSSGFWEIPGSAKKNKLLLSLYSLCQAVLPLNHCHSKVKGRRMYRYFALPWSLTPSASLRIFGGIVSFLFAQASLGWKAHTPPGKAADADTRIFTAKHYQAAFQPIERGKAFNLRTQHWWTKAAPSLQRHRPDQTIQEAQAPSPGKPLQFQSDFRPFGSKAKEKGAHHFSCGPRETFHCGVRLKCCNHWHTQTPEELIYVSCQLHHSLDPADLLHLQILSMLWKRGLSTYFFSFFFSSKTTH